MDRNGATYLDNTFLLRGTRETNPLNSQATLKRRIRTSGKNLVEIKKTVVRKKGNAMRRVNSRHRCLELVTKMQPVFLKVVLTNSNTSADQPEERD